MPHRKDTIVKNATYLSWEKIIKRTVRMIEPEGLKDEQRSDIATGSGTLVVCGELVTR